MAESTHTAQTERLEDRITALLSRNRQLQQETLCVRQKPDADLSVLFRRARGPLRVLCVRSRSDCAYRLSAPHDSDAVWPSG